MSDFVTFRSYNPTFSFHINKTTMASTPCALPLVSFDEALDTFAPVSATLDALAKFQEPLAVVCIAGLFRTGKSFLLNRVILNPPATTSVRGRRSKKASPAATAGFGVGNTVQACTKGIWMWSESIPVTRDDGVVVNVIVLDTEGSGSPSASATHDTRVSSLGLLLSSYFVYNSVGRIDDSSLSTLTTVTHITAEMRDEDAHQLPGFLWVLRDFALQLTSADGSAVDSDAYMEESLKGDKDDARAHLRRYFVDRGCATLIRPVTEESQLQNLNELGDAALRPEFVAAAQALHARIMNATARRPLSHADVMLSGSMLGTVVARYVSAVNDGAIPHIADAWESVCAVRLAEAERHILLTFPATLSTLYDVASTTTFPRVDTFAASVDAALVAAWSEYETVAAKVNTPLSDKLRELLAEQVKTTVTKYQLAWSVRVGGAASSVVDELVNAVESYDTWASFWTVVQVRMSAFESEFGREDSTMVLLFSAAQRLWDVVPVFFGDSPKTLARLQVMESELEDALATSRCSMHTIEDLKLKLDGAGKSVASAQEENDELHIEYTKAQEEVRGMTEEVLAAQTMRAEIATLTANVQELEDTLAQTEDDAERKAAEAHAGAIKSLDAVKEVRASDAKRFEAEREKARAQDETAQFELKNTRIEHEKCVKRARDASDRVATLTVELDEANTKAGAALRDVRTRDDTVRASQMRNAELERQVTEADERARKRPRVGDGETLRLVRAEAELVFLRTQKTELSSSLTTAKSRCTELERQMRTVQRGADEVVNRERLKYETLLAQSEMRNTR